MVDMITLCYFAEPKLNNMEKQTPPKIVKAKYGFGRLITRGKEYKVIGIWGGEDAGEYGFGFTILNNDGERAMCLERKCGWQNNKNWIIVERETENKHKYIATYKEGLNTTARFELIATCNADAKRQCREIKKTEGIRGSLKLKFIEKV